MRLADLKFHDLVLGADCAYFRGLVTSPEKHAIQPLTAEFDPELAALREHLDGIRTDRLLHWDNIPYRITRVQSAVSGSYLVLRRGLEPVPPLDQLHLDPYTTRGISQIGAREGLLLIAGRAGAGKTTTAYAGFVSWLRTYGDIGVTLESPPELLVDGQHGPGLAFQCEIEPENVARELTRALRCSPRFFLIGEIRTPMEAAEVLRASTSGHTVVATIHAQDRLTPLTRLIDLASEAIPSPHQALAAGLAGVVHQQMIRQSSRALPVARSWFLTTESDPARAIIRSGQIQALQDIIETHDSLHRP